MIGIPLKDDNPAYTYPFITYALLAANVLVFLYQFSLTAETGTQFLQDFGAIPAQLSAGESYVSLLTSMFLHGDILHLAGNLLYLYIFGDNIEGLLGPVRYLLFYALCGAVATFTHVMVDQASQIPMVGASGAISGVLGGYLISYPRARVLVFIPVFLWCTKSFWVPAVIVLGIWIMLQVGFGVLSLGTEGGGIAWFAHIGGFAAGMLLVFPLRRRRPRHDESAYLDLSGPW